MESYGDLLDDDSQDVASEMVELAFQAGIGAARLEAQAADSSDYWGDRILDAADSMASRDLWDPLPEDE